MDVLAKLQLRPGATLAVIGATADAPVPAAPVAPPGTADAVLAFVRTRAEAEAAEEVLAAARADRLAWIAYPKGGRLGTDLNRDRLVAAVAAHGVQPVRNVAIDETWSAIRFRPA